MPHAPHSNAPRTTPACAGRRSSSLQSPRTAPRRGSALVIVLGLLAVMMLMAVAFAIAMRTERGGASNLRHAVVARQMLDTTLARVLADLDDELAGLPAPDWLVYASTNRHESAEPSSASVLSYESAQHLPPELLEAARAARPEWLAITGGSSDDPEDDLILGRYAYVVINQTGYLDANYVGATNRLHGTSAGEIKLWEGPEGLMTFPSGAAADAFLSRRKDRHGRYESGGELYRLTRTTRTDGSNNPDGTIPYAGRPHTFGVTSLALDGFGPIQPGSVVATNVYGIRPRKFHISEGSLDNYNRDVGDALVAAFRRAFAESQAAGAARHMRIALEQFIPYEQAAAIALLDSVDEDFLPGRNASGETYLQHLGRLWDDAPINEPVPLINQFRIYQPLPERWTEEPIYAVPGDPTSAIIDYRVTIPLNVTAQSIFLNRTVPPAMQGERFDVTFGIQSATVSGSFAGKATMLDHLQAALADVAGRLESYQHVPRTDQRFQPSEDDIRIRLVFEYPASEHPAPDDLALDFDLFAGVSHGADTIQQMPSQRSLRDGRFLPVSAVLRREELMETTDVCIVGWAYTADPRLAQHTATPPVNWLTSANAPGIADSEAMPDRLRDKATEWMEYTHADHGVNLDAGNPFSYFLKQLNRADAGVIDSLMFTDYPDELWHRSFFDATGLAAPPASPDEAGLAYSPNRYPLSVGELGSLPLGPLRTVSLFDAIDPGTLELIPRHRVLDCFTVHTPRTLETTRDVPYRTAWLDGRVNLNPPVAGAYAPNPGGLFAEPLTAVLAGMPLNELANEGNRRRLRWAAAGLFARAFVDDNLMHPDPLPAGDYNRNGLAFDLSLPGRFPNDFNNHWWAVASRLPAAERPRSDFEREALLRNSVELLTTRQNVFTILLKADAFSPEFGFDEAGRGTTLATAHAIVEIWRDPEPKRDAYGNPIWVRDRSGEPLQHRGRYVAQHDWFVRFLRQF